MSAKKPTLIAVATVVIFTLFVEVTFSEERNRKRVDATSAADAVKGLGILKVAPGSFKVNGKTVSSDGLDTDLVAALKSLGHDAEKASLSKDPTFSLEVNIANQNGVYAISIELVMTELAAVPRGEDTELHAFANTWSKPLILLAQDSNIDQLMNEAIAHLASRLSEAIKSE